jgi:hypothetical protein
LSGELAKPPDLLGRTKPQLFGKTVMPRWREMGVYWQENGLVNRTGTLCSARTLYGRAATDAA